MKNSIRKIHLWLGLSSGLVVFILGITGAVYCFQEEILNATESFRYVETSGIAVLPPTQVARIARATLPQKELHSITYASADKSLVASFYNASEYYLVYIHPETGKVLQVKNMNKDFFRIVLDGHFYLWLPPQIGQPVVAAGTLIFVILLFTGVVLWWPKKSNRQQRFKIKWNAKWRRKNYDIHAVGGFYLLLFSLLFACTGLVWGYQWFAKSLYFVGSGGKSLVDYAEPKSTVMPALSMVPNPVDSLYARYRKCYPHANIDVHIPVVKTGAIELSVNHQSGTYWKTDYLFFDQKTLKELEVSHSYGKLQNANGGDLLMRMNYDIHVGQIGGITGKIIAFLASLIIASMPVTGFLIWWGRRNKPSKKKRDVASLS